MTDNVTFQTANAATPASGTSIAADEVADGTLGTVKVQYVKLMDGTLDGTTKAAVGSAGLKVDGSGATQPVSGTVAATQSGTWTVQPGNTANTTAWKVDASSVAVPVTDNAGSLTVDGTVAATQSGTWNINNVSGTVSLPTGASTAAKQPALGVAGTASADVITVQGIASMTALKVDGSGVTQPVSISGNQAVNVAQLAGTTTDTNSGVKSAGTLRVVLATDQPALTNKLLVTPDANSAVNVSQMNGVAVTMGNGVSGTGVQRVTLASDSTGQVALAAGTAVIGQTYGAFATVSTGVTRPADVTAYAANDCWSDSTSAPTSGGFTFTSAARTSGGSGIITDCFVISSNDPATLLQGELWIYDSATTNTNDNSAFASSDSDTLLMVGVIPFTMASTAGGSSTTSFAHIQNLNIGFTAVGSANLRFKIKIKNAYTPASAEVLTFRLKIIQVN